MKFGKIIRRQAISEEPFASAYCNYKLLKSIIKKLQAKRPSSPRHDQDTTKVMAYGEFLFAVAKEASKVDALYRQQLAAHQAEFGPLAEHITAHLQNGEKVPALLVKTFSSLCKRLDQLRAFVIVNYLAFMKILKKFDKKCKQEVQTAVLDTIQHQPFYCSTGLAALLTRAELLTTAISGGPSREDYRCPVCLDVLSNPVVLSCAHRFCWQCLAKASVRSQCCPVCRKEQSLDPRHYQIDSTLQKFVQQHFAVANASDMDVDMSEAGMKDLTMMDAPLMDDELTDKTHLAEDPDAIVKHQGQFAPVQSETQSMELDPVEDLSNTITLACIDTLVKHAENGNIIIVDIDETLVMTPTTCALFTAEGIKAFERHVYNLPVEHKVKVEHCARLQRILDNKVLVERNTAEVIRHLQQMGCWVLGCTARYSNMAPRTQATLASLGIDLNLNSVLPAGRALQDPDTNALFSNGIIYTNAVDKGEVLNSFFENVMFRDVRRIPQPDGSFKWSAPLPSSIVFVDDRHSNSESVLRNLHVAQKLSIPVYSYHYIAAHPKPVDPAMMARVQQLLQVQISTFLQTQGNSVLTDEQAMAVLTASS